MQSQISMITLHVVLDEKNRFPALRSARSISLRSFHFLRVHARGGLVQKEQGGVRSQGPGDFQPRSSP